MTTTFNIVMLLLLLSTPLHQRAASRVQQPNHVAANSLSPQVARKGSTLSGFVQRSRLEMEVGRDLHSNRWPKNGSCPTFQWAGKVDAICRSRSNRAKRPRAGCILRSQHRHHRHHQGAHAHSSGIVQPVLSSTTTHCSHVWCIVACPVQAL